MRTFYYFFQHWRIIQDNINKKKLGTPVQQGADSTDRDLENPDRRKSKMMTDRVNQRRLW